VISDLLHIRVESLLCAPQITLNDEPFRIISNEVSNANKVELMELVSRPAGSPVERSAKSRRVDRTAWTSLLRLCYREGVCELRHED